MVMDLNIDDLDISDLIDEIVAEAIQQAKESLAKKIVANSGSGVNSSLINIAAILQKEVLGRFQTWANDQRDLIAPVGTRFAYTHKNLTLFLVEQRPTYRTITLNANLLPRFGRLFKNTVTYTLPFPYVYYLPVFKTKRFQGMGVFYKNSPLTSLKDDLYWNNLPNFVRSGWVYCKGSAAADMGLSYAQRVESTITGFWNSVFNDDANTNWTGPRQPFGRIANWERLSTLEILKTSWVKAGTADKVVNNYIELYSDLQNGRKKLHLDRDLVKAICKDTAPEVEHAILTALKGVKATSTQVRTLRKRVEQKLKKATKVTTKKATIKKKVAKKKATRTVKKVAKKKVAKKKATRTVKRKVR